MLRAAWKEDGQEREHVAFNDVVLSRVPGRGQALLALRVDGQLLVRYASDGVIAATPIGSTAYSYAAGGPIVSPQTRAMIITPDAPHGLFNRAVVLGAEEILGVDILPSSAPIAVEVDGRLLVEAEPGWSVEISPNPWPALFVRLGSAGLRRARAAQARHHRPRRAGQLRLRRARALGRVARPGPQACGRPLRGRQCSGSSGCSRKTMWSSVPEAATASQTRLSASSRSSASSTISKTPSSSGSPDVRTPGSAAASCCGPVGRAASGVEHQHPHGLSFCHCVNLTR